MMGAMAGSGMLPNAATMAVACLLIGVVMVVSGMRGSGCLGWAVLGSVLVAGFAFARALA